MFGAKDCIPEAKNVSKFWTENVSSHMFSQEERGTMSRTKLMGAEFFPTSILVLICTLKFKRTIIFETFSTPELNLLGNH